MQKPQAKSSSRSVIQSPQGSGLLNDYHLLSYDTLDSTNEEAKRLAQAGGAHGAVVWAKQQTAGKGRAGRTWISDKGNLYVSLLLKPQCPMEALAQLSFVAAVAAFDAVRALLPDADGIEMKWPNDILVEGKKIGGILLESFSLPQQSGRWVVIGVGINVDNAPEGLSFPATSLREQGVDLVSAKIVLSRFVHHFIVRYNLWNSRGFAPIRRVWLENAWGLNKEMRVCLPHEELSGVFKGIDKDGGIVLELAPRKRRIFYAGDIMLARPTGVGV